MSSTHTVPTDRLLLRCARVPERIMRRAELQRWLRYGEPEVIAGQLEEIVRMALQGGGRARLALLAFADLLLTTERDDDLALDAVDLAADAAGHRLAVLMLTDPPPHRQLRARGESSIADPGSVPLGTRKWKASLPDRRQLQRLLQDPDPDVVARLCRNTGITEQEIVAITARRPNSAKVLDVIATSRWLESPEVRRAIIQNPYARTGLCISLLPQMGPRFLATLRYTSDVHPDLRRASERFLSASPTIDYRQPRAHAVTPEEPPEAVGERRRDVNPHIFREYDIRGIVDRDLTESVVGDIGRAFGTLVRRSGGSTVAVGRDCRVSSPRLAEHLIEGLTSAGLEVIELGMVPTPVLYFSAFTLETDAALQLTGSHNPPDFNGFKMMLGELAVYGAQIQEIRQIIQGSDFVEGEGSRRLDPDPIGRYVDWVAVRAQMGSEKVRVVVDGGNGVAGPTVLPLYERLGLEVVPMFLEPDGTFPNHHPDPTIPENIAQLRDRVLAEGAHFGIGFDGDADRLGVVDGNGRTLWGDTLMIIFSRDILRSEPGATIVGEVKCSQTLFDDIAAQGGQPLMWKVGHSLIKAKMKEVGAALAGEMSGHIFFKHRYFGFDDAIYAGARLAEIVSRDGAFLSTHLEGVPRTFATPEIRIDLGDDAVKFAAAAAVADSYAAEGGAGVREIVTIDGVRVIFEDGWGLIRASNTQPALVLRAEATTEARRDEIEADLRARVKRAAESASP